MPIAKGKLLQQSEGSLRHAIEFQSRGEIFRAQMSLEVPLAAAHSVCKNDTNIEREIHTVDLEDMRQVEPFRLQVEIG